MENYDLTEDKLLEYCLAGDKEAWNLFVKRFNRLIYHTIYKTLRVNNKPTNPDDVNDLFQDVFTSFCANNYKKLRAFDPKRGVVLASWLRMITVRMTIDHLRKSKKELTSLEDIQHEPSQAGDQEKVIDEEVQGLLKEILEELPTKDRLLIDLSYIRELPPEEAAQILQISVGAFYTRKNRIVAKLKDVAQKKNIL
jgi:RNA polymerase sigma-70 factor (ECF subfamily)